MVKWIGTVKLGKKVKTMELVNLVKPMKTVKLAKKIKLIKIVNTIENANWTK